MTKADYMKFHEDCCKRMIEITRRKNADYAGSGDDPFSNFRQIGNLVQGDPKVILIGFLTRMSDKFSRIGSFVSKGVLQVSEETVEDTLLDLGNYCILFAGYLRSLRIPSEVSLAPCGPLGYRGAGTIPPGGSGGGDDRNAGWIGKPRSDLPSSSGVDAP